MRRAGLYRRAEKIRNDHQQDRSENEVGEAEFFSERSGRGRGLQFGNGRRGAAEGGQVSGPGSLSPGKKVALVCRVRKREARDFKTKKLVVLRAAPRRLRPEGSQLNELCRDLTLRS